VTGVPASVPFEKYVAMQDVLKVIASRSPEVVATAVAQVRNGAPLENVAELVKQITNENSNLDQQDAPRSAMYPAYSPRGVFWAC
jgi:hypothetical protein